jgi:hypothetical protein
MLPTGHGYSTNANGGEPLGDKQLVCDSTSSVKVLRDYRGYSVVVVANTDSLRAISRSRSALACW